MHRKTLVRRKMRAQQSPSHRPTPGSPWQGRHQKPIHRSRTEPSAARGLGEPITPTASVAAIGGVSVRAKPIASAQYLWRCTSNRVPAREHATTLLLRRGRAWSSVLHWARTPACFRFACAISLRDFALGSNPNGGEARGEFNGNAQPLLMCRQRLLDPECSLCGRGRDKGPDAVREPDRQDGRVLDRLRTNELAEDAAIIGVCANECGGLARVARGAPWGRLRRPCRPSENRALAPTT
jgi:hypothetical protein